MSWKRRTGPFMGGNFEKKNVGPITHTHKSDRTSEGSNYSRSTRSDADQAQRIWESYRGILPFQFKKKKMGQLVNGPNILVSKKRSRDYRTGGLIHAAQTSWRNHTPS